MQFGHSYWLFGAALVAASIVLLAWLDARRRARAVERFASPVLAEALTGAVARKRRAAKVALLTIAGASACVALARPAWGWRWEEAERSGTDILFAIDTSKSMLAEDLRPSRLERAKLAVTDLVEQFDGDRAGLVAFAGEAFLESPMTMDRDAFQRALDELDTQIIPRGGTNVAAAIREAIAAIGANDHEKILVLLTDGESLEGDALAAAEEAHRAGVRIFTVGLGSADGSPVPVRDANGAVSLLRDRSGELVRSQLDETTLRRIAEITGGAYAALGQDGRGLTQLWRDHLASLPSHTLASRRHRVFTERFQWPLGLAITLLMIEPLIGERRRKRAGRAVALGAPAMAAAALVVLPSAASASPRDAEEAYRRGEFERAQSEFSASADDADDPARMHFGAGASAYRAGDHAGAIEAMDRALRSTDLEVQESAYYDRGNAQYRLGQSTLESDREATKTSWRAAIASYESALALRPDDEDAQYNLDLVRRRLAELEEESPPPPSEGQCENPGGEGASSSDQGSSEGEGEGEGQGAGAGEGEGEGEGRNAGSSGSGNSQGSSPTSGSGEHEGETATGEGERATGEGETATGEGEPATGEGETATGGGERATGEGERATGEGEQATGEGATATDETATSATATNETGATAMGATATSDPTQPAGRLTSEEALQVLRSLRDDARRFPLTSRTAEPGAPGEGHDDW